MNEYIWFFGINWFIHIALVGIVCLPLVLLNRKKVVWHWCELLTLVIPFWSWAFLMYYTDIKNKTMGNIVEGYVIAIIIVFYCVGRVLAANTYKKGRVVPSLLMMIYLSGAFVYFLFPTLPDPL